VDRLANIRKAVVASLSVLRNAHRSKSLIQLPDNAFYYLQKLDLLGSNAFGKHALASLARESTNIRKQRLLFSAISDERGVLI
jgi:hypothetical protein